MCCRYTSLLISLLQMMLFTSKLICWGGGHVGCVGSITVRVYTFHSKMSGDSVLTLPRILLPADTCFLTGPSAVAVPGPPLYLYLRSSSLCCASHQHVPPFWNLPCLRPYIAELNFNIVNSLSCKLLFPMTNLKTR